MPKLVLPSAKYKKSFLEDFLAHNEMQDEYALTGIPKPEVAKKFTSFIKELKLQAKGVFPRPGAATLATTYARAKEAEAMEK